MRLDSCADDQWVEGDHAQDKLIRVLRCNPVSLQHARRKVSQVVSDNHLSLRFEGCGQHVAVIRVGQRQAVNSLFVTSNQPVSHGGIDDQIRRVRKPHASKSRASSVPAQLLGEDFPLAFDDHPLFGFAVGNELANFLFRANP